MNLAMARKSIKRFYFQYQTEAMPKGISIEQFCSRNKVPYNIFYKWYMDTRNKIVEVKVDGLPTSTRFTIFVVEIRALRMDELQNIIGQKRGLLARESNSCPALDYSEGMAAEEQKRYINYLAERVNADDLEKRAMKLVLQDFLDKQKEYDVRLSKLDAVLSDVEELKKNLASEVKRRKAAERKVDDLNAKLKFANKNRFGDKSHRTKKKDSDEESDRTKDKDDFDGTSSSLLF